MPRGTTVEATDATLRALSERPRTAPEVTQVLTFAGTASPIDFNGMVRHYYLRGGPHVGDIRVNLLPKEVRQQQSHEILLRLRNDLTTIARRRRRKHQAGRGPARPAGAGHAGGRGLRPAEPELWRDHQRLAACSNAPRGRTGRGQRQRDGRGRPDEIRLLRGQGEGVAPRGEYRHDRRDDPVSAGRDDARSGSRRDPAARGPFTSTAS